MCKVMLIIIILFASKLSCEAACSVDEMAKLKKNGFTISEIKELCSDDNGDDVGSVNKQKTQQSNTLQQNNFNTILGQRCATQLGICGLYNLPPAPVGMQCYCNNIYTGMRDNGIIVQ